MRRILNHIDGREAAPAGERYLEVIEPATGRPHAEVAAGDGRDIQAAVTAAERAFPGWSTTPVEARSRILQRLADLIEENADELARIESRDTGKPLRLARQLDIPRAVSNFRFFATAVLHFHSEAHVTDHEALNYTLRRPRGVTGLISPWNLPLYLLSWKVAPALATGNTAVAKPSELTPGTAARMAELSRDAGLPAGVLNIVHGAGAEAGAALVNHPGVGTLSFTGGTRTGREIAGVAAPAFKKLALELGGKNANILFADADLPVALETSLRSSFSNQGQICLSGSRILVHRDIHDAFLQGLVSRAAALKLGDPTLPETDQGALISGAHRDKVESYVALAREEGGTVHAGGNRPSSLPDRCRDGFFYPPTIISGLPPESRVNQEEIFGPVVTVTPFGSDDEALSLANGTPYGLSASVWTADLSRAHRVADALDAGTVWINCWLLRDLRVPFGGMKQSGVGREGGAEALRFFTEPKNVCIRTGKDRP